MTICLDESYDLRMTMSIRNVIQIYLSNLSSAKKQIYFYGSFWKSRLFCQTKSFKEYVLVSHRRVEIQIHLTSSKVLWSVAQVTIWVKWSDSYTGKWILCGNHGKQVSCYKLSHSFPQFDIITVQSKRTAEIIRCDFITLLTCTVRSGINGQDLKLRQNLQQQISVHKIGKAMSKDLICNFFLQILYWYGAAFGYIEEWKMKISDKY
jgi:hypothetical protein